MRVTYDPEAKALYVYVKDKKYDFSIWNDDSDEGIFIDYAKDGDIIGYEFLNVELEFIDATV